MDSLSQEDLVALVRSVFPRFPEDRRLAILVDVPQRSAADNDDWKKRRLLAQEWAGHLKAGAEALALEAVELAAYPDVGSDSAELPPFLYLMDQPLPDMAEALPAAGRIIAATALFAQFQLFLAPTEYSTTAPLKNAAARYGFRAATMPGFSEKMIPALKLDYAEISRRVNILREKIERAQAADLHFRVQGALEYTMHFDLRFNPAHVSSGRFTEKGTAGNLPSGETYVVPFEGRPDEPSKTKGTLPVEIKGEVVLYMVIENRAVAVDPEGPVSRQEEERLLREPAYGNIAELGFGVLGDFGLRPIGATLLDEKLGVHVAFGRSDHFGGRVGPQDFSSPQEVVHLDRIYLQATQPKVMLESVALIHEKGLRERIFDKGKYLVF